MKLYLIIISFLFTLVFTSCFKEDEAVLPYIPPEDVTSISLQNSIYNYQIYFDLSTGEITKENMNSYWVLAFECGTSSYHIRTNSSDYWGLAHTGSTNMDSVFSDKSSYMWKSDKSDGNPDSTAVGNWVNYDGDNPVYSDEVYLLGKYDGISYEAHKKVQFFYVDEYSYKFKVAGLSDNTADTITITKDNNYNNVHYSFQGDAKLQLEPNKSDWDILFTQYFTILFTDDGTPAPYYVRGVWLNPYNVESSLDTINEFRNIDYPKAITSAFSNAQDAIGHDWKAVVVDEGSNSAEYSVRPGNSYIIKVADNELYKLRFKSFFNSSGVKGYPGFEYSELSPE